MNTTIFGEPVGEMAIKELFERKNEPACFEEIVKRYLPYVEKKAKENSRSADEYEELYSYLCEVLLDSINKWYEERSRVYGYGGKFKKYLSIRVHKFFESNWKNHNKKQEKEQKTIVPIEFCSEVIFSCEEVECNIDVNDAVGIAFKRITNMEKMILVNRYWGEKSFEDVGNYIGITRERVRQIEAKAMRKIRDKYSRKKMRLNDII